VSAQQLLCSWTISPGARALCISSNSTIGLSTCLKSSCLERGLLRAGTCGWRSAVFGSFSRSPWGRGLVILHGSAPSSC
jgi:hypothetical protein